MIVLLIEFQIIKINQMRSPKYIFISILIYENPYYSYNWFVGMELSPKREGSNI